VRSAQKQTDIGNKGNKGNKEAQRPSNAGSGVTGRMFVFRIELMAVGEVSGVKGVGATALTAARG
jgi:hypothetical protein